MPLGYHIPYMKQTLGILLIIGMLAFGGFFVWQTTLPAPDWMPEIPAQTVPADAGAPHTVQLFYYDPTKDTDETGNILCSRAGLVAVSRTITTITPIEDALRLLLAGELTDAERAAGITTEYPLPGVALSSVALGADGTLRIALDDPQHQLTGGSCRTAILAGQIQATAEQFAAVTSIEFVPDTLFQP